MKYIDFVKDFAKKNNLKYGEALSKSKDAWKKHKEDNGVSTPKKSKSKKGGSLVGGNIKMTIQEGEKPLEDTRKLRAKDVKKYNKALQDVNKNISSGELTYESYNDFIAIAKRLKKTEKDKYSRAMKRVEKDFTSKKFEKLNKKKRLVKPTKEQEGEVFANVAQRTIALQQASKEGVQKSKAQATRIEQLKRLGVSEQEANNIAKEEQRQLDETKALRSGNKTITGSQIGMTYSDYVKQLQRKNNISYANAVQLASTNNNWEKYKFNELKKNPSLLNTIGTTSLPVGLPTQTVATSVANQALLKKDGTLKKVFSDNVDKFLTKYGEDNASLDLSNDGNLLARTKTEKQAQNARETANKYAQYPTLDPLKASRLSDISGAYDRLLSGDTAFKKMGRPKTIPTPLKAPSPLIEPFPMGRKSPLKKTKTANQTTTDDNTTTQTSSSGSESETPLATTQVPSPAPPIKKRIKLNIIKKYDTLEEGLASTKLGKSYRTSDGKRWRTYDDEGGNRKAREVSKAPVLNILESSSSSEDGGGGKGSGGALIIHDKDDIEENHILHHHIAKEVHNGVDDRKMLEDYHYHRGSSSSDVGLYIKDKGDKIIIGIKGVGDKYNEENYQRIKNHIKEIKTLLPKKKMELTGRKIGAEYAEKIGRVLKLPVVLFNHPKHKDGLKGGDLIGNFHWSPNVEKHFIEPISHAISAIGQPILTFATDGLSDLATIPAGIVEGQNAMKAEANRSAIEDASQEQTPAERQAIVNDNAIIYKQNAIVKARNNDIQADKGSSYSSGGSLITSYSNEEAYGGDEAPQGEEQAVDTPPISQRQLDSATGGYGGSFEKLSDDKMRRVEKLHHELKTKYSHQTIASKASHLDTLVDFKSYHRDFDKNTGLVMNELRELGNHIDRIGDKDVRRDLSTRMNALAQDLKHFILQAKQVFTHSRTLRHESRLGNDRSILKDDSVKKRFGGSLITNTEYNEYQDMNGIIKNKQLIGGEGGVYHGGSLTQPSSGARNTNNWINNPY